jgi:hypothetical protein
MKKQVRKENLNNIILAGHSKGVDWVDGSNYAFLLRKE